ncbi:TPA: hypothetical protein LQO11_000590 [Staphylococcus pseudintermedius]|nr:hypothetical protein [Staphylococcus pseudintermedius]HCT0393285.1 hypothetical protein [Staphylococcus pseudintermedius]
MEKVKEIGRVIYKYGLATKEIDYGVNDFDNQIFLKESYDDYFKPTNDYMEVQYSSVGESEAEVKNVVKISKDKEMYLVTFYNSLINKLVKYIYSEEIEEDIRSGQLYKISF